MKINKEILQLAAGAFLFLLALLLPVEGLLRFALYAAAYVVCGGEVLVKSAKNIVKGRVFDENFLMSLATLGAFAVGQYPEGVAVMLFYQVGEMFQHHAVHKSRASIAGLMNLRPEFARVKRGGKEETVKPEEVRPGDVIIVRPGEKIPLDGTVQSGTAALDTSALTGESFPRDIAPGQTALSGCIDLNGVLEIKVTKTYGESAVSKILELVQNAASKKTKTEQFITRFARYYTPAVVITALLVAVLPPLLWQDAAFKTWIYRALIFLVVSCPCALVLSVPLGFFGGLGGAARNGVLVKGSNYLEMLARIHTLIFDKTGTLTEGNFGVSKIRPEGMSESELLELAALAESASNHPIAHSLRQAYDHEINAVRITSVKETAGKGVEAVIDGKTVLAGNRALLAENGINTPADEDGQTAVYVAVDGRYAGSVHVADKLKKDAQKAVSELKKGSVKHTVLLSGDNPQTVQRVRNELGLDEAHGGLLPADKLIHVEKLIETKPQGTFVAFVGDGINDAPVLARADVGIAMGALGSDAAIEAADVVLMTDEPSKVVTASEVARVTLRVVKQNIFFALAVKAAVLLLSVLGLATMWEAVFADVGVSVLAVLNSVRPLYYKS